MKTCLNCLHRHGLNMSKCIPCWTRQDFSNWQFGGRTDQERTSNDNE
ncbi:hypothetical protein Slip_1832 [Syntrophothermus lipocalidus DSM 12680]|uniref:Uncharacterized protein n=1 Tax=Syntrophothermus lipocalidus (strain DSM 12680 / TGB-C1) TaxID=643648 RepID=D7CPF2_SYNLT|nr:hypothetical protein Slip_1832 [Syntrophothermus lipocalidus DSM 12680]